MITIRATHGIVRTRFVGLAAAVCALCPLTAFGQQLVLELRADQTFIVLGTPALLKVTLRNNSVTEAMADTMLSPDAGNLAIEIAADGKPFLRYLGPGWGTADVAYKPLRIASGQSVDQGCIVFWNRPLAGDASHLAEPFAFMAGGDYRVRAVLMVNGQRDLVSAPIVLHIQTPVGDDATAWQVLKAAPEIAKFIQRPVMPLPVPQMEELRQWKNKYPAAALGRFLQPALDAAEKGRR